MAGTASRPNELGRVTADLVVLTVLREEYEAVLGCLAAPGLLLGSEGASNTYAWQRGAIDSPRYGATFRVVVGMGTPTTTYGALAAMQAIRLFDPRYIAFVGVAGGFDRDGQHHGDVAVSSAVVAYEYGKVDTGGFAPRGDFTYRCDEGLVRAADAVASTRWWREDENTRQPRVRTGMIASGDKLIDDPEEAFFAAVAKLWPKLLAVEMEGAGVAAAVHEAQSQRHRAGFVLVRGISDMPHTKVAGEGVSTVERDRWKRTAARNAARFLAHLVAEAWPEPPRGEVRASSDGEPEPPGEPGPAAIVASGSVAGCAAPSVGGVMVSPVIGPLPAVPIAPGAPMPPSPSAPSAGGWPPMVQIHIAPRKRSSITRNVATSVVIAALVLSVFLVVKFLIFDRSSRAEDTQSPPWATAVGTDTYGRWAAFEVNGVRQRMRWIPPGTFLMGSPERELGRHDEEGPQHEVTLSRGYWLGETPVTQALWVAVMGENPSQFQGHSPEDLERPVENVSWDDSQVFLKRLNKRLGGLFARLPTEAEWERACRGGKTGTTWVGELSGTERAPELDAIAWYAGNSSDQIHPVGHKAANPYGLYDMLGNVCEWCADVASNGLPEYRALPETDPVATGEGSDRVLRGGSWSSVARYVRAARRDAIERGSRSVDLGFRLAGGQGAAPR